MGTNDGTPARERINILLVDDQPAKLLTYEAILRELDENLLRATSARQALEFVLKHEIAVVLIDVCMPDLDGYELAAMIREHPRHRKMSIIFVSAVLMDDLDRLRGYECGAVDYVPVPVVAEILRAKVSVFADLFRKTRELERLNAELEQRVAARTAELEASTARLRENEERLRETDRRKDEFLAMLAHELRNPLAPIRTAAQLLRIQTLPDAQRTRARDIIERQVDHMVRLVDDLLDVSRISRGVITLKRERVDLRQALERALETSRPAIEQARHDLTVTCPATVVAVEGDPVRLAQVLANLLNNAARYTPEGGRIAVTVETRGQHVDIRVEDSGVGIAADDLPRVFDLFVQVMGGSTRPIAGLGIGLALVRRLVHMHGGQVAARSDGPGRGSEFVVTLPTIEGALDPVAPPATPTLATMAEQGELPRHRVVVADDNADAAEALAILLTAAGHDAHVAHDGVEALSVAERVRPDAMFLDLGMPRLNGCEAAERIRREPWGQTTLLIALTGWGHEQDRARTTAAGFDAHVVKPIVEADVLSMLARIGTRTDPLAT
jgi:signal transduction histidine kinase